MSVLPLINPFVHDLYASVDKAESDGRITFDASQFGIQAHGEARLECGSNVSLVAVQILVPLVQWLIDTILSAADVDDPLLLCPARRKTKHGVLVYWRVVKVAPVGYNGRDLPRKLSRLYVDLFDVDVEA